MRVRKKFELAVTSLTLVALLFSVLVAVESAAATYPTHSDTEPTWYYRGIVTNDTGVKMKHVTVVHDPDGLEGVPDNPKFMMWWGTSSPDELFASTSNNAVNWSGTGTTRTKLSVNFPSTIVPVYHPEVIYDRLGFEDKESTGAVHFKMWFYDAGYEVPKDPGVDPGSYNWIRYAESGDGLSWQVFEDSSDSASGKKNYVEVRGWGCNEIAVLYNRGGTGVVANNANQECVAYHGYLDVTTDEAWWGHWSDSLYAPTDVVREMIIAPAADPANYRAWDMLPAKGNVTSWHSDDGLSWSSPETGDAPISGASWSDFYGGMSVVVVGDRYYMYDTIYNDQNSVGLLVAPLAPPTEVWVDDGWSNQADVDAFDPNLIWQYNAFATIQDGIDAVADGGKVEVHKGEYYGAIVDKPLEIKGKKGAVINDGPPYGGGPMKFGFKLYGFLGTGCSGTKIGGFTFEDLEFPIFAHLADNITIEKNTIKMSVQAITMWHCSGWTVKKNKLDGLYASGGGGIGIFIGTFAGTPPGNGNLVEGNKVKAHFEVPPPDYSVGGLTLYSDYRYGGAGGDITDNVFKKNKVEVTGTPNTNACELTDQSTLFDEVTGNTFEKNDLKKSTVPWEFNPAEVMANNTFVKNKPQPACGVPDIPKPYRP